MNFFNKLQGFLEKFIGPLAERLNRSDIIGGLSAGMMQTLPITLGISVFAILVNFPIRAWQTFLVNTGLYSVVQEMVSATMSMLAIYIVICVASCYAKSKHQSSLTASVLSMGAFLCLMPQSVEGREGTISAFLTSYLGSNGIFVAMLTALSVTSLYCWLMQKNISLKMPDSVPPMVSDSLSPVFVSMIIFACVLTVNNLLNATVAKPVMLFGTSPLALIILYTFTNVLWFFGVHPSPIVNMYTPVLIACITANVEAFMAGTPSTDLPHLVFQVVFLCMNIGGNGNSIGLAIDMVMAKSQRFKSMFKLAFVPCLFNINEPMVFGVPIMLNPVFFIPMVLTTPITGGLAWLMCSLELGNGFNPTVSAPWIMPNVIAGLLEGGILLALLVAVCVFANVILYLPFFKIADNMALKDEMQTSQALQ